MYQVFCVRAEQMQHGILKQVSPAGISKDESVQIR
jgi:hypothetical protein